MQLHFISGLPRAGSTLLASLLLQNPRFHSSIMSPVGRIVTETLQSTGPDNEADGFISHDARLRVLRGVISAFYADIPSEFIFDNNRRWCANMALLDKMYPKSRVICCVRPPAAVVDSFERLFLRNPLDLSMIYGGQSNLSVYDRVAAIMRPTGVVGFALNAFKSAFYGPHRDKLLVVNYDDLCRFPAQIMDDLHAALKIAPFSYTFDKIAPVPGSSDFDQHVRMPGLHDLKPTIVYEDRASILPPDIFHSLPAPFWYVKKEATIAG